MRDTIDTIIQELNHLNQQYHILLPDDEATLRKRVRLINRIIELSNKIFELRIQEQDATPKTDIKVSTPPNPPKKGYGKSWNRKMSKRVSIDVLTLELKTSLSLRGKKIQ